MPDFYDELIRDEADDAATRDHRRRLRDRDELRATARNLPGLRADTSAEDLR